jgi:sugar phosphate isomerase/epimerase
MKRRSFLKTSSVAVVGAGALRPEKAEALNSVEFGTTPSLNAYSFKDALLQGKMGLTQLFKFASETGYSAVDLTAYFVPGYPEVTGDEVLYEIKRKAFRSGISFSGTGVRNDFTLKDPEALAGQIEHVKQWIVAASKMGAPNIRVFEGKKVQTGMTKERTRQQVIDAFRECALFAMRYGVTVAFQNNGGFIDTPESIIDIVKAVNSQWFGLMLDTSNVAGPDPYPSIASLIPYAVSWQLKEQVQSAVGTEPVDLKRMMELIRQHNYQGFIPMETLDAGDPAKKVRTFYEKYQKASSK